MVQSCLYDVLGIHKTAGAEEIRKAFHTKSRLTHPDKCGGNDEAFKKINHAYEILRNPEKRRSYDMDEDESSMFGGNSMFNTMFGNIFGSRKEKPASRGPDTVQNLDVYLKDFYLGRNDIVITILQQRGCTTCKASGALKTETCSPCHGQGVRTEIRQIGPGMIQQSTQSCSACMGTGIRVLAVCTHCQGAKYKTYEKVLNIHIVPGMQVGEKIRFTGEGSESVDHRIAGDMVIHLVRYKDNLFDWIGDDLHITHTVDMKAVLLGFQLCITNHPSGKEHVLHWVGGPIKHTMILCKKGLGMPGKKGEYGALYVHLILMPEKTWTSEQRATLRLVFPTWVPYEEKGELLQF